MDTSKLKRFLVSLGLADVETGDQITAHEQLNLVGHLNHAYGVTREVAHSAIAHHGLLPEDFLKAWEAFEEDAPAVTELVKEAVDAAKAVVANAKEIARNIKGNGKQQPPAKAAPVADTPKVEEKSPSAETKSEEKATEQVEESKVEEKQPEAPAEGSIESAE